jgi:hypothetical protein
MRVSTKRTSGPRAPGPGQDGSVSGHPAFRLRWNIFIERNEHPRFTILLTSVNRDWVSKEDPCQNKRR